MKASQKRTPFKRQIRSFIILSLVFRPTQSSKKILFQVHYHVKDESQIKIVTSIMSTTRHDSLRSAEVKLKDFGDKFNDSCEHAVHSWIGMGKY